MSIQKESLKEKANSLAKKINSIESERDALLWVHELFQKEPFCIEPHLCYKQSFYGTHMAMNFRPESTEEIAAILAKFPPRIAWHQYIGKWEVGVAWEGDEVPEIEGLKPMLIEVRASCTAGYPETTAHWYAEVDGMRFCITAVLYSQIDRITIFSCPTRHQKYKNIKGRMENDGGETNVPKGWPFSVLQVAGAAGGGAGHVYYNVTSEDDVVKLVEVLKNAEEA